MGVLETHSMEFLDSWIDVHEMQPVLCVWSLNFYENIKYVCRPLID